LIVFGEFFMCGLLEIRFSNENRQGPQLLWDGAL